jgi:hypothetical protein
VTDKDRLAWKQRRTPKRGTRRARSWRKLYPGYHFTGTAWTLVEGPYRRVRRDRSKSFVTVRCGLCQREYERRLDHLVQGLSRACVHCAPRFHRDGHGSG